MPAVKAVVDQHRILAGKLTGVQLDQILEKGVIKSFGGSKAVTENGSAGYRGHQIPGTPGDGIADVKHTGTFPVPGLLDPAVIPLKTLQRSGGVFKFIG